jgi:hypothetical protein
MAINPNTQFSSGAVFTADQANRFPRGIMLMKTLAIVAGLAIALMFVVTSCSDRIRGECITKPEAPRCDTSTGATTP